MNVMTRIAHLADLHIGYSHLASRAADGRNQRLVDFEEAALAAAREAIARKPDLAVIAGDLLHDTSPAPGALSGAAGFCQLFEEARIPLLAIGGNHDEAEGTGRYNALNFLQEHHRLRLYLDQSYIDIADVRLHLVSYRVLSRAQRGRGEIAPIAFSADKPNILVAHGYAPGLGVPVIPEGTETMIPSEWLTDPRFSLCLLGHIHHHGEIADHVFYSGSSERRNFGEAHERPGFYLHTVEPDGSATSESVFIDQLGAGLPRPMIEHELDTEKLTTSEVAQAVEKMIDAAPPGAMMRVLLHNVSSELDRSRSRMDWERRHRKAGGFSFEAAVRTRRVSELLDVTFVEPPEDVGKGLLDFVAEQSYADDVEREQALSLASEVIGEAKDKVLAQEAD